MGFIDTLRLRWRTADSLVCVGIDPSIEQMPEAFRATHDGLFAFCRAIVDATAGHACAFKPQFAHFAALGAESVLERLVRHVHDAHPGIPVILDAKRGDIGSTASHYATEAFSRYGADAVTLNPYMGHDSARPFLDRVDKGAIFLCRTSNAGAADLQDLEIDGRPLYEHVARMVSERWNAHGNCMLVVGATWPEQMARVRAIVGNLPLLVPGVGAQGGDVAAIVGAGQTAEGDGLVISSSRAIVHASREADFERAATRAAQRLRDDINACRRRGAPPAP